MRKTSTDSSGQGTMIVTEPVSGIKLTEHGGVLSFRGPYPSLTDQKPCLLTEFYIIPKNISLYELTEIIINLLS